MTTTRRRRKVRKLRGSRVMGYGRVSGGHRKSGQRGGKGKAGKRDHHWILTIAANEIKKTGFTKHPGKEDIKTINVGRLDRLTPRLLAQELATKDDKDRIKVDLRSLGVQKLLGSGQARNSLVIDVDAATSRAVEKIEAAGGEVLLSEN
ncbi:MAG: uL15 family ribosomal protein [Candidatus Heimdallarchaeota archaeon]